MGMAMHGALPSWQCVPSPLVESSSRTLGCFTESVSSCPELSGRFRPIDRTKVPLCRAGRGGPGRSDDRRCFPGWMLWPIALRWSSSALLLGEVTSPSDFKFHGLWKGAGGVRVQSLQRRRASGRDGREESPGDDGKDEMDERDVPAKGEENNPIQDEPEDELQDTIDESNAKKQNLNGEAKKRPWSWRGWWSSSGQNDIKVGEGADEPEQGVEELEEAEEEMWEGQRAVRSEEGVAGFWRRLWKQGEMIKDEALDSDDVLILQDLESLKFRWKDLLDPTPENILALALTALLALALVKITWQLVLVVITIILAALKYTVVAAFLVGLLVFLI